MKSFFTSIILFFATLQSQTFANSVIIDLDPDYVAGKLFCRTVQTGGLFGTPPVMDHCLEFSDGIATDNADTFFGNPPEYFNYSFSSNIALVYDQNGLSIGEYVWKIEDGVETLTTIRGSTIEGTKFTKK